MSSDKKNNPTGIRFNEEKLNFIKEREKLNTAQKVVNFLLDKYWWEHRVGSLTTTHPPQQESNHPKTDIPENKGTPNKKESQDEVQQYWQQRFQKKIR